MTDQFNLEEMLSILYFEAQTGSRKGKKDISIFTKAITRTIELTCMIIHDGNLRKSQGEGSNVYRNFWRTLFHLNSVRMNLIPDILTFNYDLVLERALFQIGIGYESDRIWRSENLNGFLVNYENDLAGRFAYAFKHANWDPHFHSGSKSGKLLEICDFKQADCSINFPVINYLKLHGSLNFPKPKGSEEISLVKALDEMFFRKVAK